MTLQHTDPSTLPADVRQKLLLIHTALIHSDVNEANHWLYSIACPSFTCLDPWAALEGRACQCGPHPFETREPPTVEEIESLYGDRPVKETKVCNAPLATGMGLNDSLREARCPRRYASTMNALNRSSNYMNKFTWKQFAFGVVLYVVGHTFVEAMQFGTRETFFTAFVLAGVFAECRSVLRRQVGR